MELTFEELEDSVMRIRLVGRMDVQGTEQIDLKFTSLVSSRQAFVVVDLTGVDFMSSIGLGTLVRCAKALQGRRGRMVIFNPAPNVARILESTRVNEVIPVFGDFESARLAALPDAPSGG